MDEADQQPARDELRLAADDGAKQRMIRPLAITQLRIVARNDMVGELPDRFGVAALRRRTGRCRRECGSMRRASARAPGSAVSRRDMLAGDDGGERARGRNA